ncbi:hypothetical protein D3C71_1956990 [compost metagenome]
MPEQIEIAHAAHEAVGIGEEAPFRIAPRVAQARHQLGVAQVGQSQFKLALALQGGANLTKTPAFHQRQAVLHHLATPP